MKRPGLARHLGEDTALYVAGLLDEQRAAASDDHLVSCESCAQQVQDMREIAGQVALALVARRPSPSLRDRLNERISAPEPERVLVRANDTPWRPSGIAGLEVRSLFVDPATGNVTSLVRMAPGASYPSHRHFGLEHCYVIEGDVRFNDHALEKGDYEVALASTVHSTVTTRNGCVILLVNNQRDVVLSDAD